MMEICHFSILINLFGQEKSEVGVSEMHPLGLSWGAVAEWGVQSASKWLLPAEMYSDLSSLEKRLDISREQAVQFLLRFWPGQ